MSKLPFELLLALRYLRPKRTFVSIITLISVIGVMLGVAVLIIVISVMSGFDHDLREKVFGFAAHMKVVNPHRTMADYAQVAAKISSNPNVKGVAPFLISRVMLETQPTNQMQGQVDAPYLRGIDLEAETHVSNLASNIVEGKYDVKNRGLLIGTEFASNLGLQIGDRVAIYSPGELKKMRDSHKKGKDVAPIASDYEIRGIFNAGYYEFNSGHVLTSLEDAQELYDLLDSDNVQGLTVALHDPYKAEKTADELEASLPGLRAITWMQESPLMMAVMVEKNVMIYILFFIVLVAAFGITCTLITFIMMKTREIGMMKALGASNFQIMRVFLGQSLIISIMGVFAGVGLGLLAIAYRNQFLHFMRRATGFELFPPSIYNFTDLPALVTPGDILIICGGSLVICVLAAGFPAWHASRLNPVEALRHE